MDRFESPPTPPLLVLAGSHRQHERHRRHFHPHETETGGKGGYCGGSNVALCVALSVAAVLGIVLAAANVFLAIRRARLLQRAEHLTEPLLLRSSSSLSSPRASNLASMSSTIPTSTSSGTTAATLSALAASALSVSHLVSSASSASAFDAKIYHLCLATTWATAAVLCGVSASCGRAPRIRPVAWGTPVLYLVEAIVVVVSSSRSSSSRSHLLAALSLRAFVALSLAVAQARRKLTAADAEEDALATKALLAGPGPATGEEGRRRRQQQTTDVESPAPPGPSKGPSRGWVSLLGVAIAFVWPEDPAHQVRSRKRKEVAPHARSEVARLLRPPLLARASRSLEEDKNSTASMY